MPGYRTQQANSQGPWFLVVMICPDDQLCSAWKKPNNQTVMRMAAIPAFLRNMAFTDVSPIADVRQTLLTVKIRFLGGKLGNAMATEYGAKTVGDML